MELDPATIQALGVGVSAFIAGIFAVFVFTNAPQEKTGRAFGYIMLSLVWWGFFGYLFHVVENLELARILRILSLMGNVFIIWAAVNFSYLYLWSVREPERGERISCAFILAAGLIPVAILVYDIIGGSLIVGMVPGETRTTLAPIAGPYFWMVFAYYVASFAMVSVILAAKAILETEKEKRRQSTILFLSISIAWALASLGFLPWYGIEVPAALRALAVPLFCVGAVYAIASYRLLNVQVVATELFVYAIWSIIFFRIILNESLRDATWDIVIGVMVFVVGILLIRGAMREVRAEVDRAKSEFLAIAAHQLRTPMAGVRWAFELLLSVKNPLTQEQKEIVQKGSQAATNMTSIINDILNVAMVSGGKFGFTIEPGDVRDPVKLSVSLLEEAAQRKNIRLFAEVPEGPLLARFDRGKFALAMENLIDNAIKYTQSGGSVKVSAHAAGASIVIEVADTGVGISKQEQSRLFERFFRGKKAASMFTDGSGLGLFIVKTIIDGHRGSIRVASVEGTGTKVQIRIPAEVSWK